ncbi:MAG: hypothetical protein G8D61_09110 [gamma proteobacterium symbiont of Ctena orbiculata]|nr:hypothetical protein [Candidatus Thiodiazotropha taylori]MBT3060186.1 hypothetical protein [Candidatus Thiodiazotropha sp. (ex Lucina pensylvanica)]MBT3064586.1 hypothetical protein [Candidatus Thiodiazotropha sp. (ex Lucina pensylvanica)]PUB74398.1 MAG: hypothetical protein DBO99_18770 [gamma proteobacterium symbiont of Ctena orbiculata]PUB74516.1 MAG: hypothetical protein DBP03_09685 [gamma proteobacterium symbiont of Ctena orbiculata]
MKGFLSSFFLLFLISGCGSGGSGSSDWTDSAQDSTAIPIDQQAKIDSSSVGEFLAGIRLPFSRTLVEHVVELFTRGSVTYQTGEVDLIVDNICGGSVLISGSLDEAQSTGLLTLDFSNYQDCIYNSTYTLTGSVDLTIYSTENYADGGNITIPSAFLLATSNLQIALGSTSVTMDGTLEFNHDTSDPEFNWQVHTKNYTLFNSSGSGTFTNFVQKFYTHKGDIYVWGYFGFSYAGRLYDSDSGYVDVSTVNAVATCSGSGQNCPLDPMKEGRIKFDGDNSSALIQLGGIIDTVNIDQDGNGDYEQTLRCDSDHNCY